MSAGYRRRYLPVGFAAVLVAGTSPAMADPVQDPVPIAPNQSFVGLVNGQRDAARIAVRCAGPTDAGGTGHPVPGRPPRASSRPPA